MDKQLEKLFQDQIKNEWYSAYLYLSMAAYFEAANFGGFAHWMYKQAGEEQVHGKKMFDFLIDRGVKVVLQAIPQPPADFASPAAVFEMSSEHEQKVTALINDLVNQAQAEKDHATATFLQWFVNEQVEEEAQSLLIVQQLRLIGDSKGSMFVLDHQLGKRE